jgi:hypothetical protein
MTTAASSTPPRRMILISTHSEQDYADLIAVSPVLGFLAKSALSGDAIRDLIGNHSGDKSDDPVNGSPNVTTARTRR